MSSTSPNYVRVIQSDADHYDALAEIEALMNAPRDELADARFEALIALVQAYEAKVYPDRALPLHQMLPQLLEFQDLPLDALHDILGGPERAAAIVAGDSLPTLRMVRRLARKLNVPFGLLIRAMPELHAA